MESRLTPSDLRTAVEAWAEDPEAWRPLVRHDPGERVYARLHRDRDVELYVVCWMEGHDTGFHDHDGSAAAIAVMEGQLTEERLAGGRPATSLHAYSPPLEAVGAYEIAEDGVLLRHPADLALQAAA